MLYKKFIQTLFFITMIHGICLQAFKVYKKPSPFSDNRECLKKKSRNCFKPEFIIIHYTANCSYKESWKAFFNFLLPVSTHYIIGIDGTVIQMVPESKRAWHAGKSSWQGQDRLNNSSIGIELINPGFSTPGKEPCTKNKNLWNQKTGIFVPGSLNLWYEFSPAQIKSLIELCQVIIKKYDIVPQNILGHSDIAPGRKFDPGPLFPWKKLAEHGVGVWWDNLKEINFWTIQELQEKLKKYGYNIQVTGIIDDQSKTVIQAFQMHFEQDNISGIPTNRTIEILNNLLEQQFYQGLFFNIP